MRMLITGGAGFVGASLARLGHQHLANVDVVAFDNLRRRGSEQNVADFKRLGIGFVHGDIRQPGDLEALDGTFDIIIEASAEPSVSAGLGANDARYVLDTNLNGTLNCLEFARRRAGGLIFLSSSRVYSVGALRELPLTEAPMRLTLEPTRQSPGVSAYGIAEDFPTVGHGFRSLYGTSKLASELFIEEYASNFKMQAIVNRCGVLAGAGQFGKVDQGVFTLWVARHMFGGKLAYTGFKGEGKQVRDLLHPSDLFRLIVLQIEAMSAWRGNVYGIGGGCEGAVSLREYTELCAEVTGRSLRITNNPGTSPVDIPYFVTDVRRAQSAFAWKPTLRPKNIVSEITNWLERHAGTVKPLFD